MPDWTASMQQTYEYYIVDPDTWTDVQPITNIKSSSINWDEEVETLGSASISITESVGECYIRIYLITIQNGVREKRALGTFLVQTPSSTFNGKVRDVTMDAYTPLLELKEKPMPIGYFLKKGENIMEKSYMLVRENVRAPVIKPESGQKLLDDFVAEADETYISYTSSLMANAKHKFGVDEMGRILFPKVQKTASMQPVWTYTDDNSSILHPEFSMEHDLYGVPNVIEVLYSNGSGTGFVRVKNDDPNSPTSTISRGREIVQRVTNPSLPGLLEGQALDAQMNEYANQLLRELSTLEYSVSYTYAYCPVRVGDCVRLNYSRAGLVDIKARVISQSIKCEPGCPVTEKAVFTAKLWG